VVALYLYAAVVLSQQFPIQIRHRVKVSVTSCALYLIAVLLSPLLAATIAGLAKLTAELITRKQRGAYPSDIATQVGRSTVAVLLASLVGHLDPFGSAVPSLPLAGAAVVLWMCDVLTAPLLFTPATGEPPIQIIRSLMRQGGGPEAVQYAMGILVAVAAKSDPLFLVILVLPTALVYSAFKRVCEMDDSTRRMLERMADTVDLRDPYTGGHSRRVTELTKRILHAMEVRGPEAEMIVSAARLHDIGKIGMPDSVLKKQGGLTEAEWSLIEGHPDAGADLLYRYPGFERGSSMVRHHHERWDGAGYPQRLRGTEIPFGARVIAVADSFDAMTSDRPYRPGMSTERAAEILRDGRNHQWDPAIVDAFLCTIAPTLEEYPVAALRIIPESPGVRRSEVPAL
jgi:hypothetical protein